MLSYIQPKKFRLGEDGGRLGDFHLCDRNWHFLYFCHDIDGAVNCCQVGPQYHICYFMMLLDEGNQTVNNTFLQICFRVHTTLMNVGVRNMAKLVQGQPNQKFLRKFWDTFNFILSFNCRMIRGMKKIHSWSLLVVLKKIGLTINDHNFSQNFPVQIVSLSATIFSWTSVWFAADFFV